MASRGHPQKPSRGPVKSLLNSHLLFTHVTAREGGAVAPRAHPRRDEATSSRSAGMRGRARLSADTGDPRGGRESLQGGQARDGSRACIHSWCGIAAAAPALGGSGPNRFGGTVASAARLRRECRASERGGPAEGRARSAPARRAVGAPRVRRGGYHFISHLLFTHVRRGSWSS